MRDSHPHATGDTRAPITLSGTPGVGLSTAIRTFLSSQPFIQSGHVVLDPSGELMQAFHANDCLATKPAYACADAGRQTR